MVLSGSVLASAFSGSKMAFIACSVVDISVSMACKHWRAVLANESLSDPDAECVGMPHAESKRTRIKVRCILPPLRCR
jgi:hypothetical protein